MSVGLPQDVFIVEMQHQYAVDDKVHVVNHHSIHDASGVIIALIPFTFISPAYYVRIDDKVVALSERSIERIDG
jgi:hypothetical protein